MPGLLLSVAEGSWEALRRRLSYAMGEMGSWEAGVTDFRARVHRDPGTDEAALVDLSTEAVAITPLRDSAEVFDRTTTAYEQYLKPAIDVVGSLVLLILTAPVFLAAAIAIKASMGGPILLRQDRVGRFGQVFTIYKFRTMEPDRRVQQVPVLGEDRRKTHKHPNDPRITPVGRFLRKWSLDELPQFINVITGDMSLVGPRPEMVEIVANYEPWQHRRHAVKPGITGPWQISERGDKPLHECTESDLDYIDDLGFTTDVRILALTPLAALGVRRGT